MQGLPEVRAKQRLAGRLEEFQAMQCRRQRRCDSGPRLGRSRQLCIISCRLEDGEDNSYTRRACAQYLAGHGSRFQQSIPTRQGCPGLQLIRMGSSIFAPPLLHLSALCEEGQGLFAVAGRKHGTCVEARGLEVEPGFGRQAYIAERGKTGA